LPQQHKFESGAINDLYRTQRTPLRWMMRIGTCGGGHYTGYRLQLY